MSLPTNDDYKRVNKGQDDAIAALVGAVIGREAPRAPYGENVYEATCTLARAHKQTNFFVEFANDYAAGEPVNKSQDDTIADLVDAVVGSEVPRVPYGDHVYKAFENLVEACEALEAVYEYRLTDFDEYEAEVERRRQIGLTIDPATAETMFWFADINDPYCILDPEKFHEGCVGRERFARNPGGEWVDFGDLPAATREALWERDGRKLTFPYGLHGEDVINYPPGHKEKLLSD